MSASAIIGVPALIGLLLSSGILTVRAFRHRPLRVWLLTVGVSLALLALGLALRES